MTTDLRQQVEAVAVAVSNGYITADSLVWNHAVDLDFILDSHGDYDGTDLYFQAGAPLIWLETNTGTVNGLWAEEQVRRHYEDSIDLDEYLRREFYQQVHGH